MTTRQIIVADTETSGLNPDLHTVVEVAWWNLNTGQKGSFIPHHLTGEVLSHADIQALRINRYIDRIAGEPQDDGTGMRELFLQLEGNTLAGSNPTFDAGFLRQHDNCEWCQTWRFGGWHHRLLDLSAYAAGVLGLSPTELPGLNRVCELLGIENTAPHTAAGDVDATGRCFLALFERAGVSLGGGS